MLNDIVALNNRAISFRQDGNKDVNKKALPYLREALCRLRKRYGNNKPTCSRESACKRFSRRPIKRNARPDVLSSNEATHEQIAIATRKMPIAKNYCQKEEPIPSDCENLFSFYQHAFIMSPAKETTLMDKKTTTRVYIVLLYNIGLALQMEAVGSSNNRPMLTKAAQFYESALSMIAIELQDIDPEDLLLLLALSNNLGHIHSQLMNFSETQKYLVWLRHLVKAYQQCNKRGTIISDRDYSFFVGNSLLLEDVRELCCAPTA